MGVGDDDNKCQVRTNISMGSNLGGFLMGNQLGRVLEVEKRRNNESQNFFMQVKVAIPLEKEIR